MKNTTTASSTLSLPLHLSQDNPPADQNRRRPVPASGPAGLLDPTLPAAEGSSDQSSECGSAFVGSATYSPDDNKLRLYPFRRLDRATYERVKAEGFAWAPKQDLFVAPAWTPGREDLLAELCGEIDDEDKSLAERAEERAERFSDYSENRVRDATSAHAAVAAIADNIPFGQPILIGHHSERRARRDAERIENGMRKAVKLWNTSTYWTARAAGAIRHAKYKERPDVRARRIKKLESEGRGHERGKQQFETYLRLWERAHEPRSLLKNGQEVSFLERAQHLASVEMAFHLSCDLREGKTTPEQAQAQRMVGLRFLISSAERWIAHIDHRLSYERAMLASSGWTPPAKAKTAADLPLLNYPGKMRIRSRWRTGEIEEHEAVSISKAEWAKIDTNYKGTRVSEDGTHRVRFALEQSLPGRRGHGYVPVFLTDSKQHGLPGATEVAKVAEAED